MEATPRRLCPGCESAMQVLSVGKVELDRCPFCGGVWFDRGELERIARRRLTLEPLAGGHTTRRCAFCRTHLSTALIEAVPAEVCDSCLGTYLDDGELQELAGEQVKLVPRPQESSADAASFRCPGCGEQGALQDGFVTARGVTCGRCYGMIGHTSSPTFGGHYPSTRDALASGLAGAAMPGGSILYWAVRSLLK